MKKADRERIFKRNEKLKEVLGILIGAGGLALAIACPILPIAMAPFFPRRGKNSYEREQTRMLSSLKKLKLISIEEDGRVFVTKEGGEWFDYSKIDDINISDRKIRDKYFRVVAFDIKEQRRIARDFFRKFLKRAGFIQFQKSVFICPYPCEKEVREAAEILGIEDSVCLMRVDKIDREEELRKEFGL